MATRIGWITALLLIFLLSPLTVTPTAADSVFEDLRNQPPPDSDTTTRSDTPAPDRETRSETNGRRLDPVLQVFPPLRSDTFIRLLHDDSGGTLPGFAPRIRLILPPGENTPGPTPPTGYTGVKTKTRASTEPGGIRYVRRDTTRNVTGPFTKQFFVGLRWPGVSVGFHEPPYTVELKYLDDSPSDISIIGLRLYHHVIPLQRTNYYWGLDLSRIDFEGAVSEGNGTSTGIYFGFYREIAPHLSWSLDMGPYYIYLRDEDTRISADGLEYTVTTGLNVELW